MLNGLRLSDSQLPLVVALPKNSASSCSDTTSINGHAMNLL
jgi:hypothetical protein